MLAAVGFILVVVMVAMVIWGKIALPPILIILPTIAVIILGLMGYLVPPKAEAPAPMDLIMCFKTLQGYLGTGLSSTLNTAALFTFAVVFFNVLGDAGMFDLIVSKAMRYIGNSVTMILLMTFKIEFDQYDGGKTYHGLDKLCLNNLIQDNTMMKDYLTYRLMGEFGVNAPLCSYAWITVNGEDWGLYLAVEGVEDAFLRRNYGRDPGELYKPDSMNFGAGRGNGRDFDMEEFVAGDGDEREDGRGGAARPPEGSSPAGQEGGAPPEGFAPSSFGGNPGGENGGGIPEDFDPSALFGDGQGGGPGGGFGGKGSGDVKLQYTDDDPDSYPNIFDSAKTDITQADRTRLIQALKALGEGDVDSALDMDQVLRYLVVHNFVVNGDSYTGSMVHNYYLYEEDGRLSMLPWDYNLAFGTFQGNDAGQAVNDPIDTPLSVTGSGDRPMADWILASEEYTALYHQYFEEFLSAVDPAVIIDEARALIAPYVEQDPTRFCSYEEFEAGVEALETFCRLRAQSVSGQLSGAIPSTEEGQAADGSALVDASGLTLSHMGTMDRGGGPGGGGAPDGPFGGGAGGSGVPAFGPDGQAPGPP